MQVDIRHDGTEREPLAVIDGFWPRPEALIDDAARRVFAPVGPFYPGVRAAARPGVAAAMRGLVAPVLAEHFGLAPAPAVFECFYSLVTTPPAQLAPIQRLPHFDGLERERIAVLLFLTEAPGGTAFYRHRATGFETVTADRYSAYDAALHAGVREHGLPPPSYIAGDTPLFERIRLADSVPNRALVYRGNRLHCAHLPPGTPFSADPRLGRLTVNLFLYG
jgi:hypothetical protein